MTYAEDKVAGFVQLVKTHNPVTVQSGLTSNRGFFKTVPLEG